MELVPTSSAATYADLERLPPGMVGELLGGEVFATPRPAPTHALVAGELHGELWSRFQRATSGPGGWWILFEPELHLDGDVLVPDLAGWRVSTMPHTRGAPVRSVTTLTLSAKSSVKLIGSQRYQSRFCQ